MSLLAAFMETWSQARSTFGQGPPTDGSPLKANQKLHQIPPTLKDAQSGSRWHGPAADAYDSANARHTNTVTEFADLDERFAAEIDRSAEVVTKGRSHLDEVKSWVVQGISQVPNSAAGQRMQIAIVRKGIEDLTGVIEQTRTDQSAIAARLEGIAKDYATLVPRRAGRDDIQNITGENEKPDDESIESQVARWYVDWRMLEHEIATHNAGVAAFNSRKPPPGSPAPVVAAWNAERLRWNAEAEALHLRQMQLYSEGILLNIPVEQPDEPVLIDAPFQIPGTAPSGFNAMTPATVTTTKVHTVGP